MGESQDNGRKIFMSGGRIFDADPERVSQKVITALQNLADREHENRLGMRCQRLWNTTRADNGDNEQDKMSFSDRLGEEHSAPDQSWMVPTPDEYIQYLIPESVLEDMWRAREEQAKKDILGAKLSVRNVAMPDLRKCNKMEHE